MSSPISESSNPAASLPPLPSTPFVPEHELIRMIGRGSYGEVWLGRTVLGGWRAVKVVRRASFSDSGPFEREYEGIQRFEPISRTQKNLTQVLQVGSHDGYFYYVLELADHASVNSGEFDPATYEARTLRRVFRKQGALAINECIELGVALARGLAHLHKNGLVHGDLKPANIIYVDGTPKLADVGLVARVDAPGSLLGTAGYFPSDGMGKPGADVYSLGKILYEAFTGLDRHHFPELLKRSFSTLKDEHLGQGLNRIILRCCDPDPVARFADAAELEASLERLVATAPADVVPPKRAMPLLAALAISILAAILVAMFYRGHVHREIVSYEFAASIGTPGTRPGQFLEPVHVRVWNGNRLVVIVISTIAFNSSIRRVTGREHSRQISLTLTALLRTRRETCM